jgi:ERCC4-type nuclease
MTIVIDTREPDPHPWPRHWRGATVVRGTLACGDVCLEGNADVCIERKTPEDLIGCLAGERERFERELRRATHLASFAVVVSGSLDDLLLRRRGLHVNAIPRHLGGMVTALPSSLHLCRQRPTGRGLRLSVPDSARQRGATTAGGG